MKLEKALTEGEALKALGWRLHNIEFTRQTGPVYEIVALRRGRPMAFASVDLPEAEARIVLREHGYGRGFKRLYKGRWGAQSLPRFPLTARAFARHFAAWDPCVIEFQHGQDVRLAEVGWYLFCSYCWFPAEGASWTIGLHAVKTRRRPDLKALARVVRTFEFNGSARVFRMRKLLWFPIHEGPARSPALPFARRFLRFLAAATP